jgi:hypothetical protein
MDKITVFVERLQKIGIEVKLGGNYPWVYIDYINGKRVTEKFQANHGFTLCFIPIKKDKEIEFTDITEIFKLIRKYTDMTELQLKVIEELEANYGWSNMVDDVSISMELLKDTVRATEKVVKNLTTPDVSNSVICPNCDEECEPIPLGLMCNKCYYDKL